MKKVVTVGVDQHSDGELVTDGVEKEGVIYLLSSKDSQNKSSRSGGERGMRTVLDMLTLEHTEAGSCLGGRSPWGLLGIRVLYLRREEYGDSWHTVVLKIAGVD